MAPTGRRLAALSLTALGVVYGDIGTSPLYAFRERFKPDYRLIPDPVVSENSSQDPGHAVVVAQ